MQHHKIEITADHLQRFSATSPIDAVAELIWNAVDADATQVLVETHYDVLGMMSGITVRDNGTGIPFDEIVDRFKKLGESWKRSAHKSKQKNRFLHGKDGQGRFKALSVGIVDLMLSRAAKPERSGELEHLIIELKRPTVLVDIPELIQAYSYAAAVASDARFSVGQAEWEFWVISAEMSPAARAQANQAERPPGLYHDSGTLNPKVRVWARTWSEIINDAKVRMNFYKERLQLEIDSDAAVRKLKKTYSKYFEEPAPEETTEDDDQDGGGYTA